MTLSHHIYNNMDRKNVSIRHAAQSHSVITSRLVIQYVIAGEGGVLNCEAKAQVPIIMPPLFFLEVGRKKGKCNIVAVRYVVAGGGGTRHVTDTL